MRLERTVFIRFGHIRTHIGSDDEQERALIEQFASEHTDGSNRSPRSLATLVINVWHEPEHSEPLRARITARTDDSSEEAISYAASEDAIVAEVRRWLRELAGGQ